MNEDIISSNYDFLMTETEIVKGVSADKILSILKVLRTDGRLEFILHEGGVRRVALHEKTKMSEPQRDEIRKILKME